jgi:hypothetical protein
MLSDLAVGSGNMRRLLAGFLIGVAMAAGTVAIAAPDDDGVIQDPEGPQGRKGLQGPQGQAGLIFRDGFEVPPGAPGPGPGPNCVLPPRSCVSNCSSLTSFNPRLGTGYDDYPINGETDSNQYRSFLRRDNISVVQYAAAVVACKAAGWTSGHGAPIGLGDMSEANGAIPGTSVGAPGHPAGTHTNGLDIDVAYFQQGTVDNHLRPVCEHEAGGADQYHCVTAPDTLDVWRTALFVAALASDPAIRVIGVDGRIGPQLNVAIGELCRLGWTDACRAVPLAFEVTDGGQGWFLFHHHNMHVSFRR